VSVRGVVRRVNHRGYLPSPEREARSFVLHIVGDGYNEERQWFFRRRHLAVQFAERHGIEVEPECRKCRGEGMRPPTKAALKSGIGAGGRVCTCAAGGVMHAAWQGLVSPGH
jgi:hypothetical protein